MKDRVSAEHYFLQTFQFESVNPLTNVNPALLSMDRKDTEHARFCINLVTKVDLLSADVLSMAIKVERKLDNYVAATNLVMQLHQGYLRSAEYASYKRGAFDE
ncbi:MAG: hypothetical protein H7240_02670 [Glaciimonas sp.]|nr:hypothetical protein [Glaciimonas sp.]